MMAAPRTVVVATAGLDAELAACIEQACAHAGAQALRWAGEPGDAGLAGAGRAPGAVLATLAPGERQIPDRLVQLVTRERPGTALLLLCRESLVRPSVTLQNGRVTLVEPPFSVRRIASRLRVLLAADSPGAEAGDDLAVREDQRPGHWLGVVSATAATPGAVPWAPAIDQSRGLTAVVPSSAAPLGPVIDLLAAGGEPEALAAGLVELVGTEAGVIHLSPRGDEWLLFWPWPQRPLWLCSSLRLPPCWDLGATAQESPGHCFRVAAAGGDVVVTLSAGLSDWALGAASPGVPALVATEMADTVADGGPALLEAIAARLRGSPGLSGALVIEAR